MKNNKAILLSRHVATIINYKKLLIASRSVGISILIITLDKHNHLINFERCIEAYSRYGLLILSNNAYVT